MIPLKKQKLSLHKKLFLVSMATIILVSITLYGFFYIQLVETFSENTRFSIDRELEQFTTKVDADFKSLSSMISLINLDPVLMPALQSCYELSDYSALAPVIRSVLPKYTTMIKIDPQVAILAPNGTIHGNALLQNQLSEPQYSPLLQKFLNCDASEISWIPVSSPVLGDPTNPIPYIYIASKLTNYKTSDFWGVIVLRLGHNDILNLYSNYTQKYQSVFILDQNNNYISQIDNLNLQHNKETILGDSIYKYSATFMKKIPNKNLLVSTKTINSNQWKIATVTDFDYLLQDFYVLQPIYIATTLLLCLVAFFLSYIFLLQITRPIKELSTQMSLVKKGDFNAHVEIISNDEIGELSVQFNSMIKRTRQLIDQIVAKQEQKRKSDIVALQSQINPHFLFNCLTSVRSIVYMEDKKKADQVLLSLTKLLKDVLTTNQAYITIGLSIENLKNYITIQQLCAESQLQVTFDISDEIQDYLILSLLLQPIVENAILHGLKLKKDGMCMLKIQGYEQDDTIIFNVIDNGIGFDATEIENSLNAPYKETSHIGIVNVHNRIRLNFGSQYGLKIKSLINEGTVVTVSFPKISMKEGQYVDEYPNS